MDRQKSPFQIQCRPAPNLRCLANALLIALLSLVAGCRTIDNAQVDLLESELRQKETYIYELEDYLLEYSEKLRKCRADSACNGSLRSPTAALRSPSALSNDSVPKNPAPTPTPPKKTKRVLEPTLANDAKPKSKAPQSAPQTVEPTPVAPLPAPTPSTTEPDDASEEEPDALPEETTPFQQPSDAPLPAEPSPAEPLPEDRYGTPDAATEAEEPALPSNDPEEMPVPDLEIGWQDETTSQLDFPSVGNPLRSGDSASLSIIPDPVDYVASASLDEEPSASESAATKEGRIGPIAPSLQALPAQPGEAAQTELSWSERRPAKRIQIRRVIAQDGDASEEALLVVVEALNDLDEPVELDGQVSLMAMVVDAPDSFRRIERWDFSSDEASSSWQSTPLGDGLHLQLPLTSAKLPPGSIELWARVVAKDGSKMLAKIAMDVAAIPSLDAALASATSTPAALSSSSPLASALNSEPMPQPRPTAAIVPPKPAGTWRAATTPLP